MSVKPIPDGFSNIIPFLVCKDTDKVIDFCKKVFDAKESHISRDDKGIIMHATIHIRDNAIMLSEGSERYPAQPAMLYIYTDNCDEYYKRAIDAGGVSLREPTDEFYGDRSCGIADSSGNQWWIATHTEDVSDEELIKRQQQMKH